VVEEGEVCVWSGVMCSLHPEHMERIVSELCIYV
jgi:hypothetical protein